VAAPLAIEAINLILTPARATGWVPLLETRDFSLLWRAILALTISYSAFIAEVFRAGLQSVDKGQLEAARALGLSRWSTFRFVSFPLAFRTILPPLGNDFISMVKDSALVSVLGVGDITQMAKVYASGSFLFFETYNVVAIIYLLMTVGLSLALRRLEARLRAHERG
jgi:polar amino acid transport system permease protein